uniref:Uncharacterized protein n=1 Tax=Triticum urartu TaxID=4572 RepID=A0A8R7PM13_TRIUA
MAAAAPCAARRSFRESLKVLEADIQHANNLASDFSRDYDGACLQMRMSYMPRCEHFPLPPAADRLQHRRRPRPPQDPHLQGLCGRHHNHLSTHERKPSTKEFFLRCDISLPCATGTRDQRHRRPEAEGGVLGEVQEERRRGGG